jgi:hypothetical protein
MPRRTTRQDWSTDFPPEFLALANLVAKASLPAVDGPHSEDEAHTARRSFYAFRDVLRASVKEMASQADRTTSHPARLSDILRRISVKVKPIADSPGQYNLIFDDHPIVKIMKRLEPATAQVQQLSHAKFIADQRLPVSQPMFSDEEMQERLDDIAKSS